MTVHENAKFTCERLVNEYEENGRCSNDFQLWDVMKIIENSFNLGSISKPDAERYCYHLHVSFDEMMTA